MILWRRDQLKVSFDYLEDGWFSSGDELDQCKQRLVHMIDGRLQSGDVLPFVVQLPQEFIDEHAKVCHSQSLNHSEVFIKSPLQYWTAALNTILTSQTFDAHEIIHDFTVF